MSVVGSDLYARSMAYYERHEQDGGDLQHRVWDQTPWMVDVYTGSMSDDRDAEIRDWCHDRFGPECWPIHGVSGNWHRGGATIHGWTWFGFATEAMMSEFVDKWRYTHKP